jgi:tetratricopeptide (TPR) repeat protein
MDDEPRVRALREASRLEPVWDRPPFELGLYYFEKRDCELALPWLSRVPPDRPDGLESEFMTGVCHLLRNEAARAEASFTSLIERSRDKTIRDSPAELPQAHNNLGVARLRLGKWADAAAEFERAATIDSEEPDYRVNLGLAKLGSKQTAAAVIEFEHARDLDPMDKGARSLLAAALELAGRGAEAATIRSGAIDNSVPASPDSVAIARLARITMRLDRGLLSLPEGVPVADPPVKNSAPSTPHGGA